MSLTSFPTFSGPSCSLCLELPSLIINDSQVSNIYRAVTKCFCHVRNFIICSPNTFFFLNTSFSLPSYFLCRCLPRDHVLILFELIFSSSLLLLVFTKLTLFMYWSLTMQLKLHCLCKSSCGYISMCLLNPLCILS